MAHGYETDRLDLPFVGHCTFGKRPPVTDWGQIDADVAVLGIPCDMGTQWRSGARFDPSIAPGTGTPSHGGFLHYEVMEILQGLSRRGSHPSSRRRSS
ncbi:MAG: arginase family protein [Geminicoccaceae bacterium]|nr:arginase family protein [Geminicoccaceae bacterium]